MKEKKKKKPPPIRVLVWSEKKNFIFIIGQHTKVKLISKPTLTHIFKLFPANIWMQEEEEAASPYKSTSLLRK